MALTFPQSDAGFGFRSELKPGENTRSASVHQGSPCWFSEGQANGMGITTAAKDLASYMEARDNSII